MSWQYMFAPRTSTNLSFFLAKVFHSAFIWHLCKQIQVTASVNKSKYTIAVWTDNFMTHAEEKNEKEEGVWLKDKGREYKLSHYSRS